MEPAELGQSRGPGRPRTAGTQAGAHWGLWKGGGPHREAWQGGGQGALLIIARPGEGWRSGEQLADPQRTGPSPAHSPLCPPCSEPGQSPMPCWLSPLPLLLLLPGPCPMCQPSAPSPGSSSLPLPPAPSCSPGTWQVWLSLCPGGKARNADPGPGPGVAVGSGRKGLAAGSGVWEGRLGVSTWNGDGRQLAVAAGVAVGAWQGHEPEGQLGRGRRGAGR